MSVRHILVLGLLVLAASSCKRSGQEAQRRHGHDEAGQKVERPTLSKTVYQGGLELFLEYPALVVGKPAGLVAHFTDARDPSWFKAVSEGRVTAVLRHATGGEERFVAEKLLRTGIFKPVVTPTKAGEATLTLSLEGAQAAGTVDLGKVLVHPTAEAGMTASAEHDGPDESTVPFLKEQQWKTRYATAAVTVRVLQGTVRANGELKPVAGQAAELSTPVAGRIPVSSRVPRLGQRVRKGEVLATVSPTSVAMGTSLASLELEVNRGRAELGLAERELRRAEELLAGKAIPEKQVDAARTAREVAAARLEAAQHQRAIFRSTQEGFGGQGRAAFELRAPLDGVVAFADVTPGAVVEAGARLVMVVNPTRLWLEVKVYEADAPRVERSSGATFTVAGFDEEFLIDPKDGRKVAVGAVIDRATRTVPMIFELPNPDGALKPGMFAKVNLFTGKTVRGVAVPESAVVDDNGRPVVFVMSTGEAFHKRLVQLGVRSGGFIQVTQGVSEGERVVSQGAYEVKLSTATGALPEHGHQR